MRWLIVQRIGECLFAIGLIAAIGGVAFAAWKWGPAAVLESTPYYIGIALLLVFPGAALAQLGFKNRARKNPA